MNAFDIIALGNVLKGGLSVSTISVLVLNFLIARGQKGIIRSLIRWVFHIAITFLILLLIYVFGFAYLTHQDPWNLLIGYLPKDVNVQNIKLPNWGLHF